MKTPNLRRLFLGLVGLGLLIPLTATSHERESPVYGRSGYWGSPIESRACAQSQRCADWHDATDGGLGPQTSCCVEVQRLPFNSFSDCLQAVRYIGPRDGDG
ncbi:MAG: hypothetical protein AAF560_31460 [Acidobacteriota bacterium]